MNIKIREVDLKDLDSVVNIEQSCFPKEEAATKVSLKKRIETFPKSFFVAEINGVVVGFINGAVVNSNTIYDELYEDSSLHCENGKYQSIFGLDVIPKYQHNGIAKKLMKYMINIAKEDKRKGLILTCKKELIGFYESFGYKNKGISKSSHGGAIWYDMILEL